MPKTMPITLLLEGHKATAKQLEVFTQCVKQKGTKFLHAKVNKEGIMQMDYMTNAGYFVRKLYSPGAEMISRTFYSGYDYQQRQPLIKLFE